MDWFPLILSIKVATISAIFAALIGVPLGRMMSRKNFHGKDALEALLLLPMVLPPSVLGYMLLMLLGKYGPVGSFLIDHGINIIFTQAAAVIAATIVALPLMYQNAKGAFSQIDTNLESAARTLGASEIRVFGTISLPLAFPGLMAGFVLAFTRGLGEFGATMMVAGNIPGRTQTIPLAIYFAVDAGKSSYAAKLVLIVTVFSFLVILWSNWWVRRYNIKGR
jgi:molybdate transport system permease protein